MLMPPQKNELIGAAEKKCMKFISSTPPVW